MEVEKKEIKTMSRIDITIRARPIIPYNINSTFDKENSCAEERAVDINEPEGQVIVALNKTFQFDNAFDGDASQVSVYKTSVFPLVDKFVQQCDNVSILAYGQTGSGKTHTMMGNLEEADIRGMIPRSIQDVFAQINPTDSVCVSFFEIYNEKLYDLLTTNKDLLTIREENNRFIITDLSSHQVKDAHQAIEYLKKGNTVRSTASTGQNETSSRSHAIFRIKLTRNPCNSHITTDYEKQATLSLVDLAGSESVRKTEAAGERLAEGNNINKGLLSLGNCISDICHKKVHIPYRNSALTKVLRESLQSGGWTGMIVCISPTEYDISETLNTLRYANRAKELTKPPVPKHLLIQAEAQGRKRKFATVHIPPTPANWKRPPLKMNNTIETPTPSKRHKVLNGSKIDTAHSFTFATPSETPSDFHQKSMLSCHSVSKNNMLASAVKRNMDKFLQDIEEESSDPNRIEDETLQSNSSPPFGSEISSISPYTEKSKTVTTIRKEVLTNMASPNLRKDLLKSNATSHNITSTNNMTMIDMSTLSPMIRRITNQVCQQFEQRCSRMEENLRQQFENTFTTCRRSPRICEKTAKETPMTVRKQFSTERKKKLEQNNTLLMSETLGIGGSPEEIVSGMPFAEIRKEMRDSQNLLYHNAQDRNEDKGSEIISFKKPHKISQVKMNHLNKVAPTASPLLAKTPKRMRQILAEDKENIRRTSFHLTPRRSSPKGSSYDNASQTGLKSPTLLEMERSLGINPKSPGYREIFKTPSSQKLQSEVRSSKRLSRRQSIVAKDIKGSNFNSQHLSQQTRAVRRSVRLSEKVTTNITQSGACNDAEFKQPFEVKEHWKVKNQDKHNARLLGLLNSANLKVLQAIPAIGPKTAYVLMEHRELHNGFSSFEDLKKIPGLRKNFYAKFVQAHQIIE